MSAVDTIRNALYGSPPTATFKPSRDGVLAAFTELQLVVDGINADIRLYATKALLDADTTRAAGTQARVYADSTAANNKVYYWSGSAWVVDINYYNGLAAVVQPLVDLARDWASKVSGAVDPTNYPGLLSAIQYAQQAAASQLAASNSAAAISTQQVADVYRALGVVSGAYNGERSIPSAFTIKRFYGICDTGSATVSILNSGAPIGPAFNVNAAGILTTGLALAVPANTDIDFAVYNIIGTPTGMYLKTTGNLI
jgi:hypothetical protein